MLNHYLDGLSLNTQAFDGITNLIEKLTQSKLVWGIATNKPWRYTEPLLKAFEFAAKPATVKCPEHVINKKPAPDMLLACCEDLNIATHEAIYVGDHKRDIECGKNANMKTIAVSYGNLENNDKPERWQADYTIDHANDIWPIIQTLI